MGWGDVGSCLAPNSQAATAAGMPPPLPTTASRYRPLPAAAHISWLSSLLPLPDSRRVTRSPTIRGVGSSTCTAP